MENRLLGQFIQRIVRRDQPQSGGFELDRVVGRYPLETQKALLDAYAWDSMLGYGVRNMIQGKSVPVETMAILTGTRIVANDQGKQLAVLQTELIHETWRKNNVGKFYLGTGEIQCDLSDTLMSLGSLQAAPIDVMTAYTNYETNMKDYMRHSRSGFLEINDIVARPYDPDEVIEVLTKIQNGSHYVGIMYGDLDRLQNTPPRALSLT